MPLELELLGSKRVKVQQNVIEKYINDLCIHISNVIELVIAKDSTEMYFQRSGKA